MSSSVPAERVAFQLAEFDFKCAVSAAIRYKLADAMLKVRNAGVLAVQSAPDPLERAKQIRERVAELEAEAKRLIAEHKSLTGGPWGKVDADDLAWATAKDGVGGTDAR